MGHNEPVDTWILVTLVIILVGSSIFLGALILLHKSRGDGVTDVFGTGVAAAVSGSSVGERNLTRWTIATTIVWVLTVGFIGYGISVLPNESIVEISGTPGEQVNSGDEPPSDPQESDPASAVPNGAPDEAGAAVPPDPQDTPAPAVPADPAPASSP